MLQKQTVRILLLNPRNELLLMRVVDPTTTGMDRKKRGAFWCTIGGKIEEGESLEQAALRELFEETGFTIEDVTLGQIVWYGKHEMIISGQHMELTERFIVMYLNQIQNAHQDNFTDLEKSVVTDLAWLSLEKILNQKEPIYPAILKTHLVKILNRDLVVHDPEWVDLSLEP